MPPLSEHHGHATPFSPPFVENSISPVPYYEGYTIRPDDFASSEDRWSLPPKKSIPATQEDLHTEVIRQRQSGRTACRELEDCHGPKRQYIDRLIKERNASNLLGHFEVAQLRLERIPKDSGKSSNRSGGRNYHAREYKQKDSTKPRQKTVYMHIILQFIKDPKRRLARTPQDGLAPCSPNVGNSHRSATRATPYALNEDNLIPLTSSDKQFPVLLETSHRPLLARGYPYTTGNEQASPPPSSRYISQSTQTTFRVHASTHSEYCSGENTDDATIGNAPLEDTWTTTTSSVEEEMPRNSPSSDDEAVPVNDNSAAAHEMANESTEEESRGIDEYERPSWFQNLQPGLLPLLIPF